MAITTTVTSDIETDRASGQTEAAPAIDHSELTAKNERIRELQAQVIALRDAIECGSEEEF